MRRTISMRCMIASDAACIAGGFVAAMLVVQALQSVSIVGSPRDASMVWQDTQATVNRSGKADPVRLSFEDRFGRELWIARDEQAPGRGDDPAAVMPDRAPPTGNTTIVPKGLVISSEPTKATGVPARAVPATPKPAPSPIKAEGCDPLASPLVEPDLAQFAGRCLTELPVPTRNST